AALNYVYLAGPGASIDFTMPYRSGEENITVSGLAVESVRGEGRAQAPLLIYFSEPVQIVSGSFTIRNEGGVIVLE
ncbi:MAG: hypothetical protein AB1295_06550, partial [Candidatus Micrarchaeota archaeon]